MKVVCDVSQVVDLAARFKNSSGEAINSAAKRYVNRMAEWVEDDVIKEVTRQVRLPKSYVEECMWIEKARDSAVSRVGARRRSTRLATYASRQLVRYAPRAKGDKLRGIPAGMKQAGVMVGVKRNTGQRGVRSFFFIPLKAGPDKSSVGVNGMGVFVRIGPGDNWKTDFKHLYGPSVYQVYAGYIPALKYKIQQHEYIDLKTEAVFELKKVLAK